MKRKLMIVLASLFILGILLPSFSFAQQVPVNIRNNVYFLESVRQANLANLAFDEGDYVSSYNYSQQAIHYANLSDEFVLLQLKIRETDEAIAAARRMLDFADSVDAGTRYPDEYSLAQSLFTQARTYRASERWDDAIEAANQVLVALAGISEPGMQGVLPSQYTVRQWNLTRDSFWVIAGWPWVYNDPSQWRVLYDANRDRIPDAGNPDLILPGMVMLIPSLRGEARQGMYEAGRDYTGLLPAANQSGARLVLPGQYTVRSWATTGDSFSAIAGWSWVYNDSSQWRVLYDANRDRIPQPDNPDLILPGMIMLIPSLGGEVREGMWDANATYPTFSR